MRTHFQWWVILWASVAACDAKGTGPGAATTPEPDAGDSVTPTCQVTNFTPSPGLEGCFNCMLQRCCEEMRACDGDPDCVYCTSAEGQLDTSERCVDPHTFSVYPNRRAFGACQVERCVSPCGAAGGSDCTPSNCASTCARYATGCR